jgi:hypothetical protein
MSYLNDRVYDNGLAALATEGTRIDICSQEPTTYAQATSTYSLGNKTAVSIAAPSARTPNGRKVTVPAVSGGSVTATGTASHWAIVDPTNTRLLAAGALSASQAVTNGNTFTLTSFDIGIPAPA